MRPAAALLAVALAACSSIQPAVVDAPAPEEVVEAPPRRGWFERHRSADGSWDPDPAAHPCGCLAGDGAAGVGRAGATGLAVLHFLECGQTHKTHPCGHLVRDGLRFLRTTQGPDGCFSALRGNGRTRDHAMAALAMAENHAATRSLYFRESARRGIDFALSLRGPEGAWSEEPGGAPDLETTAWMTMALRAGAAGDLPIEDGAFDRVRAWLDRNEALADSWPESVLLALHLCGAARTDPSIVRVRALTLRSVPRWDGPGSAPDLTRAWFGSLAMFATSEGRPFPSHDAGWMAWYEGIRTLRLPEYFPGDCRTGSFGSGPRQISDTALAWMIQAIGYR